MVKRVSIDVARERLDRAIIVMSKGLDEGTLTAGAIDEFDRAWRSYGRLLRGVRE